MRMPAVAAMIAALTVPAHAGSIVIHDVVGVYPNDGNVTVPGYGQPWATPILFDGMVVFCNDLDHNVYVGGGQNLEYVYAPLGTDAKSAREGWLTRIGTDYYYSGNVNAAIAAQAEIWATQYNVVATSTNAAVENYIVQFSGTPTPDGVYAVQLLSSQGYQSQLTAIPELSTWAMMLVGLGSLGMVAAQRRKTAKAIV